MIEIGAGPVLAKAPLRIDERVLHFLVGVQQLDARLAILIDPCRRVRRDALVPSHAVHRRASGGDLVRCGARSDLTVVQLCGSAPDCRPIAAAAAASLASRAASLPAERLPSGAADLDSLLRAVGARGGAVRARRAAGRLR